MDIVVTTPKSHMKEAAAEAFDARAAIRRGERPQYFRRFPMRCYPISLGRGERVYYVEDGHVRGFAVVVAMAASPAGWTCSTTGRIWPAGWYVFMDAKSWRWIEPVPMKGFQGFRYAGGRYSALNLRHAKIVGGWVDPKPEAAA